MHITLQTPQSVHLIPITNLCTFDTLAVHGKNVQKLKMIRLFLLWWYICKNHKHLPIIMC